MATTPNYGFITPAPTNFVTNLPADFELFGDAVDQKIKDLNPETTQGDIAYRGSVANAKVRLPIGTAGQLLRVNSGATAPEWFTPAAAAGLIELASGTLSGAQVDITSIPTTYKDLMVVIRNYRPVTDGSLIRLRYNNDSNTRYATVAIAANATNQTFDSTEHNFGAAADNTVAQGLTVGYIHDYANTVSWKTMRYFSIHNNQTTTSNYNQRSEVGVYNQTGAITQLNLFTSSGNFAGGTYLIYGVQ